MEMLLTRARRDPIGVGRCREVVERVLSGSPYGSMLARTNGLSADCVRCDQTRIPGRAVYDITNNKITVCADRLAENKEVEEALRHEIVHAHDNAMHRLTDSCSSKACSEIRACAAVDCRKAKYFKECVKDCAVRALTPNASFQATARSHVDALFDVCSDSVLMESEHY